MKGEALDEGSLEPPPVLYTEDRMPREPALPPPLAPDPLAALAPVATEEPQHVVLPPARRARRVALVLSIVAVTSSLGCGIGGRRAYALYAQAATPDLLMPWVVAFLVLLLLALLLRMGAAICELLWLERTWSNLPGHLRNVGPVHQVSGGLAIAISFVPGVAWLWKLGLIVGIADGFETIRAHAPFVAPVPKRLGVAAVIVGWVPGLNVYLAPFLWELFATRIDACVTEILAQRARGSTYGART